MPAVNEILAGAANLAARSLALRQDTTVPSTALSSTLSSLSSTLTTVVSSAIPTMTTSPTSTIDTAATATQSQNTNNNNNNTTSSPLLFFVALGFGVVFTNLWIIVGVKYCFRYNARNRALRMAEDDPITMENMPRPHRRRREKKLMTMDEVNEKFPMQKYKNWVASRAQEGLPTAGGVSAPASRANSVQDVEGVIPELPKERDSTDDRPTTSADNAVPAEKEKGEAQNASASTDDTAGQPSTQPSTQPVPSSTPIHNDDDEEDDEQINAALPPECMGTSGDTCAICIDTLEDDDDVRGLTCGHAFHAGCLDPWLTSRRACCPLCKADYYTPKPRRTQTNDQLPATPADGAVAAENNNQNTRREARRREPRMNLPQPPQSAWQSIVARGRRILPGSNPEPQPANAGRRTNNSAAGSRSRSAPSRPSASSQPSSPRDPSPSMLQRFRLAFPHWQMQRAQQQANNPSEQTPTPGQLESGVRP